MKRIRVVWKGQLGELGSGGEGGSSRLSEDWQECASWPWVLPPGGEAS